MTGNEMLRTVSGGSRLRRLGTLMLLWRLAPRRVRRWLGIAVAMVVLVLAGIVTGLVVLVLETT